MNTSGWYAKVISRQKVPEIRWITVQDFWVNGFINTKEKSPVFCFHCSKVELLDSYAECGMVHSFKLKTGHNCTLNSIIIMTPNQFDIAEIRTKITEEKERWNIIVSTSEPFSQKSFVMDMTGKFLFRPSDRISVHLNENTIKISQLGKEDHILNINATFDTHPTLETESDVRWIIMCSDQGSWMRLHCASVEEMKDFVTKSLHIASIPKMQQE